MFFEQNPSTLLQGRVLGRDVQSGWHSPLEGGRMKNRIWENRIWVVLAVTFSFGCIAETGLKAYWASFICGGAVLVFALVFLRSLWRER